MNKKFKKTLVALLSALMVLTFLPVLGSYAAATTCHIGDVYYATLAEAISQATDTDTIIIDSADAGIATIDKVVKLDVGTSGYDLKNVTYNEAVICKETTGTVTSYALHNVPAIDGGVTFNWDTSVVPATATVTIKDANGHTQAPKTATVEITDGSTAALCEEDHEVEYTATCETYTEKKTVVVKKTGHLYTLKEESQSAWWDGKKYNSKGIPIVKNVKVYCNNEYPTAAPTEASALKDAEVEFVEAIPSKTNPPTCTQPGEVTYTFKVIYDGAAVKDVTATKPEDRTKDKLISIVDHSAPATGVHTHNDNVEPSIQFKAYKTTVVDGKEVFVSALDSNKTVTDKKDAAVEWLTNEANSAYGQGYDDVLTYRIVWTCKDCGQNFYGDAVTLTAKSTTAFYLANGTKQQKDGKDITAADKCTAKSIETGTFDPVKIIYAKKENGSQKVKNITIAPVARPAKTDYEPQHNAEGVEVVVVDPTHTTKGSKSFTCADCGQDVVIELPTVGAHKFVADSEKTVAPTCTTIGYTYKICETCADAHLAPVGTDGKPVKDLPASFTTEGAIVSATTPALGHNYVVLNSDSDAQWAETFTKDNDGNPIVSVVVSPECARCRDKMLNITYHSDKAPATGAEPGHVYEAISNKVTKAKNCTEYDTITFTVDGIKDYNTGKDVSKAYKDTVFGPHAYTVKTVNFSADGKSANATIVCGNDTAKTPCHGEKERVISITSTASAVDTATGLTTYTASISDANLRIADIDKAEINTAIPAAVATKKLYDLSKATVTVPNYDGQEAYNDHSDKDVEVKIGDVVIDPKYYTINWPTVTATDYEKDAITASGTSKKVTFEVTKKVNEPVDTVTVAVNGKDPKTEREFDFVYNGKENTLVATTKTKDAKVTYLIDGKAADAVALKDVKLDKDGNVAKMPYEVQYVIRYKDGRVYTSGIYKFTIAPASVKLIKADYEKVVGTDDPAIEYDTDAVAEGDDLKLTFEKHSEKVGTYKLDCIVNNPNYVVVYPTYDKYLVLVIRNTTSAEDDAIAAANAAALADQEAAAAAKEAEEKIAAANAAAEAATTTEEKAAAAKLLEEAAQAAKVASEKADAAKKANDAAVEAAKKAYGANSQEVKKAEEKAAAAAKAAETAAATAEAAAEKAGLSKLANPMTVKAKTVKAKASKKTTIKKTKAFTVKKAKGKVTFKKVKGNKKVTITKAGKVVVKKGLKVGKTFKIKVKVTAKGNTSYKAKSKTVTLKVKIVK